MAQILVINGPNLNLLGTREPHIYGAETLADIAKHLAQLGADLGVDVVHFQHNCEGDLVTRIQQARGQADFIIINAGAYTHTSVAIRDALAGVAIPFVEVHISNVHAREAFRHHSYLSDKAVGVIVGLGTYGYEAALRFCVRELAKKSIN
ncbi:type II 3-dehydroquinate dehydratase [Alysiella crassa]|uniref:3-dehydroquinate dehydratase n=1 Tax=Alysiella crassa TaxID=153491 RepID=A0A376BUQ9_9NEIS|nr:type II 3-dehydroquinate dehydratase [Alysiella crassa]SSY80696.1 3-dehydroquinate dehydratase [Alysiella crassa]